MQTPTLHQLEELYRHMSDGEILRLAGELDSLTAQAKEALNAELRRRNLEEVIPLEAAERYHKMSNSEILCLAADFSSLTDQAKTALNVELRRRGMEEVVALEAAEGSEAKEDSVEGTIGPSIDVTASGIILLLGSALQLLSVFGILLVWTLRHSQWVAGVVTTAFENLIGGAWSIATAIGILHLRPWARISILVMSIWVIYRCVGAVLVLPISPSGQRLASAAIFIIFIGLGVGWLVQFTSKKVERQFQADAATLTTVLTPMGVPSTAPRLLAVLPSGRPLSITIIAVWLVAVTPLTVFLELPNRGTAFLGTPLAAPFSSWTASVYVVTLTTASVALGLGLLRMKRWARTGTVVLCILWVVGKTVSLLRLDTFALTSAAAKVTIPHSFIWLYSLWEAVLPAVALWFLVTRTRGGRMSPY